MSDNPRKNIFFNHDDSYDWKYFLSQLRQKAFPHINKHFHEAEDQEDVLADLMLSFLLKLLKNRSATTLNDICPTTDEQHQFIVFIKDRVIDIDRKINGRKRLPSEIKEKSAIEQQVYKKRFMQKLTADVIVNELCRDGKIEEQEILLIIEQLESELGERARKRSHGSFRNEKTLVRLDIETTDFDARESPPDQSLIDNEQNILIRNALAELDAKDQLILQYRYVDEMEISAIAQLLNCPMYRINYRLKRGTRKLEKYFKECGLTINDLI